MRETILIIIVVFSIFIFIFMNKSEVTYIEAYLDKTNYLVRNEPDKYEAANLLANIMGRIHQLRGHLIENKASYSEYSDYIDRLANNLKPGHTQVYETEPGSEYTSYSVNKGEELVFCLRSKEDNKLHDINLMMYVALHEISHIACPEIGHTPLFKNIFAFFTNKAHELNLYRIVDYGEQPVEYCGMILSSSIV